MLSLSDPLAVQWLTINSIGFAMGSMSLSIYADHQQEDTLYLSAGFILSAIAIKLLSFPASIIVMIVGAAAITLLRRMRRA
jgi:sugar phosphate permease